MAYNPDLSGSYLYWSGTEQVTLTFRDHLDAETALTDRTVKRHSKDDTPATFSEIQAQQGGSFWSIPSHSDVVGANVPAVGTMITDASSVVWIVQRVQERRIAGSLVSWWCWAVKRRSTS